MLHIKITVGKKRKHLSHLIKHKSLSSLKMHPMYSHVNSLERSFCTNKRDVFFSNLRLNCGSLAAGVLVDFYRASWVSSCPWRWEVAVAGSATNYFSVGEAELQHSYLGRILFWLKDLRGEVVLCCLKSAPSPQDASKSYT